MSSLVLVFRLVCLHVVLVPVPAGKPDCVFLFRHFEVKSRADAADAAALFSVPDFVGDACKAIASRIRGAVASVQFDDFHKVRISAF